MINLDHRHIRIEIRPGIRPVVKEIVDVAWQIGGRNIWCNHAGCLSDAVRTDHVQDSVARELLPDESALSVWLCSSWVEDRNLIPFGIDQSPKIAAHHSLGRNGDQPARASGTRKQKVQASEEKGLVAAVIHVRNDDRTAQSKASFVLVQRSHALCKVGFRIENRVWP